MLAATAGGATAPAVTAGINICQYLCHQLGYVKNIHKNFDTLVEEANDIKNRRDDVLKDIHMDTVRKMPTKECEAWLKKVGDIEKQVNNIDNKYKKARNCLCGWCPFWLRLNLSKDMKRLTKVVCDLKDEGKLNNGIVTERPRKPVEKKHALKTQDIPSLDGVLQKIIEYLRNDSIKRIGIWGMAGVGKTTIMKKLNDARAITEMFDIVIWVTISKEPSMGEYQVQQEVVQRLKLNVEGINSIDQVATLVSDELENKKYLLLLDAVFSGVNLHDMGIRQDHRGGKIVFATRFRTVCQDMETNEEIKVERLSEKDSWNLFREKVGDDIVEHPHIRPMAELIVKECGALPWLISVVARTLRKKVDEDLWWNTLWDLQSPSTSRMEHREEVLKAFKLGYDQLQDDDSKNCLLYGALYPNDYDIHRGYLMECWSAEGFIGGVENLINKRQRGRAILEDLLDRCLLESSSKVEYVKMPMAFRDPALRITSLNNGGSRLMVKAGEHVQELAAQEEWQQVKTVSLMCNELCTLPERPNCCMISTLLLQKNSMLTTIPGSFFDHMSNLRVLDLYNTGIVSLPSSLSSLINLKALYLNSCIHLVKLPIQIVELKNLEVLDIRCTKINDLPIEIGELTRLRCLRMSFDNCGNQNHILENSTRVMIPQNVVSKLSLLEELSIDVDLGDQHWDEIVDAVTEEVATLEILSTLHFYFPRVMGLENFIRSSKSWNTNTTTWKRNSFRSFKFHVGCHNTQRFHGLDHIEDSDALKRHLIYSVGEGTPAAILKVLSHALAFELVGHKNARKLSDFGVGRMEGLKVCLINECNKMESVIDGDMTTDAVLPFLEKLHMINLPNLETIWEGSVRLKSLAKLKFLTLNGCPKLKKIFSWGMIQLLFNLQILRVENCCEIEEIIIIDENEIQESGALPKLKTLQLLKLPRLASICRDDSFDWPSLEEIEISRCEELKKLPLTGSNATKLRSIKGENDWWETLVWQDDTVKERLQPFHC